MTDIVEQHKDEVHKIAIKIDRLITDNPRAKPRFTEHIDRLCKMVEDYGQALQPYEIPFRKALEKIRKDPKFRNMTEYKILCEARKCCPLPENWIEIPWQDTKFIKVGDYPPTEFIQCFAQPQNVVNPLVWFELEGSQRTSQRAPDKDKGEDLMLDCVLLGIVHDRMMERTSTKLFPIIGGKWFERVGFCYAVCETFCNDIHPSLRRDPQSPIPPEERGKCKRELREKLSRLKRARDHVQTDLKHCTSQIDTPEKLEHRIDHKQVKDKPKASKKPENPYDDFLHDIAYIFPLYPFRQGQKDARNDILVSRKELDELKRLVRKGIKKSLTKEEHKRFVQLYNKMPSAERLTNDEIRLIWQLVGSYDMDYIGDFLIKYCNVPQPELNNISWPNILKRLKSLRHLLQQGKKLQAALTSEKKDEKPKLQPPKKQQNKTKDIRKRFSFEQAQAFFDIKDLELPTGADLKPVEILKKLVRSFDKVVKYKVLDKDNSTNTASNFLRGKIRVIKVALRKHKVPCKIDFKKWEGYILTPSRARS